MTKGNKASKAQLKVAARKPSKKKVSERVVRSIVDKKKKPRDKWPLAKPAKVKVVRPANNSK